MPGMKLGLYVRNMGPQSTRQTLLECARAAEQAGIDHLWVADHVAIPPDQAEGSGGRYLDPLATLAFLATATTRIGLGTGVLVLPYRPPLATAKWIATIQELSAGRLACGVGAGWMEAEFRVVGADRAKRGEITDRTLEFLHRCFASDEVEEAGQRFLFLPRPKRPPIFVGGVGRAALRRAARFGDGWMPTGIDPKNLAPAIRELAEGFAAAGKAAPEVVALMSLPLEDPEKAIERARALAGAGVTALVHGARYEDSAAFARNAEILCSRVRPALEVS
jgi:probable F420-dependent oxidoreductase